MIEKVKRRIELLEQYTKEEEGKDGIEILSLQSFKSWIKMIDDYVQESLQISLTPDNEIYVNWTGDKRICLRFHGSGLIKIIEMKRSKVGMEESVK